MVKARKKFCVVAYDIADNKRRVRVAKLLERFGVRVNESVFECMIDPMRLKEVEEKIGSLIKTPEDKVIFYSLCIECYAKIKYLPGTKNKFPVVKII